MTRKPKMKRLDYTCDECKRSYHTLELVRNQLQQAGDSSESPPEKGLTIHQGRVH